MIGSKIMWFESLDSTNALATRLAAGKEIGDGGLVITQKQTHGRGQRGNTWESEPGKNLTFSLVLFPDRYPVDRQFRFSMGCSLALVDYLNQNGLKGQIKWPNDLLVGEKKIAGILIETGILGANLEYVVIGIGLNLNQEKFESDAPNPVSMKQLMGDEVEIEAALADICLHLNRYLSPGAVGSPELENAYLSHLVGYQVWKLYRDDGGEFSGKITGVSSFGQLMMQRENGEQQVYNFKEVQFL
jgi:BirA family biotin operon repressor/biotin-[acetyl-CoA-carboxylase] ligase